MKIKSILLAVAISLILSVHAAAATDTWSGAVSTDWSAANWSGGNNPPLSGDTLAFGSANSSGTNTLTDSLANGFSLTGLVFNAGTLAYTMTGNSFTLGTGGITNSNTSSGKNITINNNIAISGNQTWTATSNSAITILGGNLSDSTTSDTISINGNGSNGAQLPTFQLTGSNSAYKGTINFVSGDTGGILLGSAGAMTGGLIDTTTGSHNNLWLTANSSGSPYTFGIDGTQTSGARVKMATGGGDGLFLTANNGGVGGGSVYWDPGAGSNYTWSGSGTNADTIVIGGSNDTNPDMLYLGNSGTQFQISAANKAFKYYGAGNNPGYVTLQSALADGTDTTGRTLSSNLSLLVLTQAAVNGSHPVGLSINGPGNGNQGLLSISNVNQLPGGNLALGNAGTYSNTLGSGILVLNNVTWSQFTGQETWSSTAGNGKWQISGGGIAARGSSPLVIGDNTGGMTASTFNTDFDLGSSIINTDGTQYANQSITLGQDITYTAGHIIQVSGNTNLYNGIYTLGNQVMTLSGTLQSSSGTAQTITLSGGGLTVGGIGVYSPILILNNSANGSGGSKPLNITTNTGGGSGYGVLVGTSDAAFGGGTLTIGASTPGSQPNSGWLALFSGNTTFTKSISYTATNAVISTGWGLGSYSGNVTYTGTATIAVSNVASETIPFSVDAESGSTIQLGTSGTAATFTNNSATGNILQYRKTGAGTAILNNITFNGTDTTGTQTQFNIQNGALQETGNTGVGTVSGTGTGVNSTIGAAITLNGGVLETNNTYESGGFTRTLSTTLSASNINMTGGGGFSAYGGPLTVNLGGASAQVTFGGTGFVASATGTAALVFGSQTSSGTVTFVNPIALNGAQQTIQVNSTGYSNEAVLSGVLSGNTSSGLIKTGTGVLALTATNTYGGATTINAGTLAVNGSTAATSAFAVNNGGSLAGTGTVGGAVTVNSGGAINLTDGVLGTLTVGGLITSGGGGFTFEINGTGSIDKIQDNGVLTLGGTTNITIANLTGVSSLTNGNYNLLAYTGALTGTLSNFNLVTTSLDTKTLTLTSLSGTLVLNVAGASVLANQAFSNGTPTFNIITGATTTVGGTLTNTGTVGANNLVVSLSGTGTGGNAVTGLVSTTAPVAVGTPASVTGTFTAGSTAALGTTWTITNTDNTATTTTASVSGTANVYGHANPTLSGTSVSLGSFHVGYASALTGSVTATDSTGGPNGSTIVNLKETAGTPSGSLSLSSFAGVTPGGSSAITVTLATGQGAGAFNTTLTGTFADDSTFIGASSNLGAATITVTGTGYNLASSSVTSQTVNVGAYHVGTGTTGTAVSLTNASPSGTYTETLQSNGFSGTASKVTATGSVTGITGGNSGAGSLLVGLNSTAGAGTQSGTTVLALQSNAVNGSGLGTTSIASDTITVTGTGYNLASSSYTIPSSTINLGAYHVNGTAPGTTVSITNLTGSSTFTENLDEIFSASSNVTTSGFTGLGGGASHNIGITLGSTASSGVQTGSTTLTQVSDTTGIVGDTLGNTTLSSGTITVTGTGYNLASANTVTTPVNLGSVHMSGTFGTSALSLTNTGSGVFTEALDGSFGAITGSATGTGTVSLLAAGSTDSSHLVVGLGGSANTGSAGTVSGTIVLVLTSDGSGTSGLGTTPLTSQNIAVTGQVYSGNSTWATAGSGAWGTLTGTSTNAFGANWGATQGSPGLDPGFTSSDSATFGTVSGSNTATVSLNGANPSLKAITFNTNGGGYTLASGSSGSFTLNNGASAATLTDSGTNSASQTISSPIVLASNLSATVTDATDKVTLSGTISQSGGSKTISKAGAGTLFLNGQNTYTGGTTVTAGILQLGSSTVTGSASITSGPVGTGTLTLADGSTLMDNGSLLTISNALSLGGTINLASGGTGGGFNFDKGGLTTGNVITLTATTTLNVTDNSTITDNIVGNYSLTKIGSGTLNLTGTNSSTAPVTVTNGTVQFANGGSLGSGGISLANNTTLQYTGTSSGTLNNGITITGTTGSTGVISNTGGQVLTLSGTINKYATTLDFGSGKFVVSGIITGNSGTPNSDVVLGTPTGSTTVGLTSANTYNGPTTIYNGSTLLTGVAGALPTSTPSVLTLGGTVDTSSTVNTLDLLGTSQTVAGINDKGNGVNQVISSNGSASTPTIGGTFSLAGPTSSTGTLTVNVASGTDTFGSHGGILGDSNNGAPGRNANSFSLTKTGTGTLALTGAGGNTYTGGTTITAGTLMVSNTSGSATGTGALNLNSGAILTGTGTIAVTGNATISGTVNVGNGGTTDVLTMTASGTTNFSGAHLTFNLNTDTIGQSSELALGNTPTVLFGGTSLTINLTGTTMYTSPEDYTLFTSTVSGTNVFGGLTFSNGYTDGSIVKTGLTLNVTGTNAGFYAGTYLELKANGGGFNIVAVIPEPSTWALMLGGLALLVFFQRIKRNKDI